MTKKDLLIDMLHANKGYLLTADVIKANISKTYLAEFVKENNLERAAHGVYISDEIWQDEMFIMSLKHKKIVYSHETALMLHGLMEREVASYSVTVPRGYNSKTLREKGYRVYTQQPDLYYMGITSIEDIFGNVVPVYDMERTICDIVKRKKHIDIQIFQTALKEYTMKKDRNLHSLIKYAQRINVEEQVRNYIEVLL